MELRKAGFSDLDRIMEILSEGRMSLAALGTDQWQGGYPQRNIVEADIQRGDSYVVIDDEGVLSATAMMTCRDEVDYHRIIDGAWLTDSLEENPCYVVVHRVAVSSRKKNGGIGARILAHAEEVAREIGCTSLRIDTHPGNIPMQRLLDKSGFARCGTILIAHAEEATPERIAYEKLV